MMPSIKTLGDILYSLSQYVIPVFQAPGTRSNTWSMSKLTIIQCNGDEFIIDFRLSGKAAASP